MNPKGYHHCKNCLRGAVVGEDIKEHNCKDIPEVCIVFVLV
jgi:hypothetical protein